MPKTERAGLTVLVAVNLLPRNCTPPSAGMHPLDVWTIIGIISGPQGRRRPQPPGGRRDSLAGLVCVRGECMPGSQPDTAAWATAPGDDPCVFLFRILVHAYACRGGPKQQMKRGCIAYLHCWACMQLGQACGSIIRSVGRYLPVAPTRVDMESPSQILLCCGLYVPKVPQISL
jgi:hypothetical protein